MSVPADHNFLLGLLALRLGFLGRDQLHAAMNVFEQANNRRLGDILVEQKSLDGPTRVMLEALVERHLAMHDNDPQKCLAALDRALTLPPDREEARDAQSSRTQIQTESDHPDPMVPDQAGNRASGPLGFETQAAGASTSAGNRFRILRLHARGGLGQVYVAYDAELRREVALKEIQAKFAHHPESKVRFLLEAEVTGGLEHPGIVPVYGLGHYADGRPFYAMRFIRGDSLKEAIERFHQPPAILDGSSTTLPEAASGTDPGKKSPTPDRAGKRDSPPGNRTPRLEGERLVEFRNLLGRFVDVCQAIAYAHSRGVLHRDLKPGNIMLGKFGETLVVDWGLAKTLDPRTPEQPENASSWTGAEAPLRPSASGSADTLAGSAIGTPAYMSPEQAEGRLDLLGPASDVYSLGATLYHLLVGKIAFGGGSTEEVLARVRKGEFPAPRKANSVVPPGLEAICLKAMALRGADRYASPRDLAEDVEHWLADEPVRAWREPWSIKARRWFSRHRTLAASAAAVLLVATAALIVGNLLLARANDDLVLAREQADREKGLAEQARALADAEKMLKEQQLRRAEVLLYNSYIREAFHHWQAGDFLAMGEDLQAIRKGRIGPEYNYLARQLAQMVQGLGNHDQGVTTLVLAAGDKHIYTASQDGTIRGWDLNTDKFFLTLGGHAKGVTSLALRADGKRLYSASMDKTIKVWDLEKGEEIETLHGHTAGVWSLALSPDGERLFSGSADQTIRIWDLKAAKPAGILTGHTGTIPSLALSPDGKRLYSGSDDRTIKVWDLESGKKTQDFIGHTGSVWALLLSTDGKRLFSGGYDKVIREWDLGTGKTTLTLAGHTGGVWGLVLKDDGRRLLSGSYDSTIKEWDLEAGRRVRDLRGHGGGVTCLALSSDGRLLFSGSVDKTIKRWNLEPDSGALVLRGHTGAVTCLALTHDDFRLYSGDSKGAIWAWDLPAGRKAGTMPGHADSVTGLILSADGRQLFSASSDRTIKIWDLEKFREESTLRGHAEAVTSLALSPDGTRLYSASHDRTIKVWDLKERKELPGPGKHSAGVTCLAIQPDGSLLFSGSEDGVLRAWNPRTATEAFRLPGHPDPVWVLVRDGEGKRLFSGSDEGTIRVWDLSPGKGVRDLRGHTDWIAGMILGHEDRRLLSASNDGTIRIWDLEANREALSLRGHTGGVTSLVFSRDGSLLLSGGTDRTIRAWNLAGSDSP